MPQSPKTIRLLVADDHPIVRQGLVAILNDRPDMNVVAEVNNGQQAIDQFRIHQPDVAILDLKMPEVFTALVVYRVVDRVVLGRL
jgi:DNA-binding NarL/FixJ family response regulator